MEADALLQRLLVLSDKLGAAAAAAKVRRRAERLMLQVDAARARVGLASGRAFIRLARDLERRDGYSAADALVERALVRHPDHASLLVEHALLAQRAGRLDDACTRWTRVKASRPDVPADWCHVAASLRKLSRLGEASATIKEALARFPDDLAVVVEAARIADHCGENTEALALWARVLAKAPGNPDYMLCHTSNLLKLGRLDEAEAELGRYSGNLLTNRGFLGLKGQLATAREDWDGAIAIWTEFQARYPKDMAGWEQLGRVMSARQLAEIDQEPERRPEIAAMTQPVEVARVEDAAVRALLLGYESLGNDCEFGMVQRRYGAEPLGLLRWNYVPFDKLLAALDAGLEGMGEPDNTELWLSGIGEYFIRDRRWDLGMHTFMFEKQIEREAFLPKICRRVSYLRDKFVADLASAEKTYVFKAGEFSLDDMHALHDRLRRFGDVRLLCVRPATMAEADAPLNGRAGEVFEVAPNLHLGFIDRLGGVNGYWDIAFDDWVAICRGLPGAPALTALAHAAQ